MQPGTLRNTRMCRRCLKKLRYRNENMLGIPWFVALVGILCGLDEDPRKTSSCVIWETADCHEWFHQINNFVPHWRTRLLFSWLHNMYIYIYTYILYPHNLIYRLFSQYVPLRSWWLNHPKSMKFIGHIPKSSHGLPWESIETSATVDGCEILHHQFGMVESL